MIDLRKCDITDMVFNRYKESYKCVLDTEDYMSDDDVNVFLSINRKNMRKDLKRIKREYKKMLRLERRKERKEEAPASPSETLPAESVTTEAQAVEVKDHGEE